MADSSPDRNRRLELIERLGNNPQAQAALEEVREMKRSYESNLGKKLMTGPRDAPPVDQREIDYQRGFYRGMLFVLTLLPRNAAKELERGAKAPEESDTA